MARKKETKAESDKGTKKKLQQPLKTRRKKQAVNGAGENEETIKRKVKPKPRPSVERTVAESTSKYFQSPVTKRRRKKKEDDFIEVTPAEPECTVKEEEEEDSEEDDWEEVEELAEPLGFSDPSAAVLPVPQSVEIEIETPAVRKRQKRQAEVETYLRRMMNRYKKDLLIDTHKVHLMCLVASARFRNSLCSEPDLLAVTMSLLPAHFGAVAKERINQNFVSGLHKWFRATFTLNPSLPCEERWNPRALLERRLASLSAQNHQEMTHLFLLVLRSLQLFCRLVVSLQPLPFKPPSAKGKGSKPSAAQNKSNSSQNSSVESSPTETKVSPGRKRPSAEERDKGAKKAKKKQQDDEEEEKEERHVKSGQRPKNSKRRSVASKVSYKEESNSEGDSDGSEDEEFKATSEEDTEDEEEKANKKSPKGKKAAKAKNLAPKRKKQVKSEEDCEENGENEDKVTSTESKKRKRRDCPGADEWLEVYLDKDSSWVCVEVDSGVVSPQVCSQNATQPLTYVVSVAGEGFVKDLGAKYDPTWMTSSRRRRVDEDWWEETLEPFVGPEDERDKQEDKELQLKLMSKPLPVTVSEYKNHPLYALKRHLLKYEAIYPPSAAVLGYCRGESVYSRYENKTGEPVYSRYENKTGEPVYSRYDNKTGEPVYSRYENKTEEKPVYSRYENRTEESPSTPGTRTKQRRARLPQVREQNRGEPVYPRDCVHTLHSRDTWLKEARTVRLGEEPYKMVRGFSNRSRKARMMSELKDPNDLALFGEWQTEEYQPPIAVDGKVPRNDYGNVYLFKPCMLPVGCVHLHLPNLHRVARKLNLDAAPAVTGFDFHGGYSHAVTDGYIVCEEHEEVLRAAWVEEQELYKQKEKEKREKRALSNWTLMVKGLLIRERLKQRYGKKPAALGAKDGAEEEAGGFSSDEEGVHEAKRPGEKTASETLALSWPQNRQTEEEGSSAPKKRTTKRDKKGQEQHMFPFEKV